MTSLITAIIGFLTSCQVMTALVIAAIGTCCKNAIQYLIDKWKR